MIIALLSMVLAGGFLLILYILFLELISIGSSTEIEEVNTRTSSIEK